MKPTRIFFWLKLLGCLLIAGQAFAQQATPAREAPQQITESQTPISGRRQR